MSNNNNNPHHRDASILSGCMLADIHVVGRMVGVEMSVRTHEEEGKNGDPSSCHPELQN